MNGLIARIRDKNYLEANTIIRGISGIVDYFSSNEEKADFVSNYEEDCGIVCEDKISYGDWQTPDLLANKVCENHRAKFGCPDVVIEPTCGLGAFILSALRNFPDLSEIHAVEIREQYVSDLKLRLLMEALRKPNEARHPDIFIYNADVFNFDFSHIIGKCKQRNWSLAIIGNPPWVTNSRQGMNNSKNVPLKNNSYGLKGIEAITGKSNFDISEYITLHLLKLAQDNIGGISFLLKNSVIRNIIAKQKSEPLNIGEIEQLSIDASLEFNVSVEASCFSAEFSRDPSDICFVKNFYTNSNIVKFGWVDQSFVSNINLYQKNSKYDNHSELVWRSGIKHDCSAVLELTYIEGVFQNGFGENVRIEEDVIFPLLKSSDINHIQGSKCRKFLILPQHRVGDDTSLLKYTHPLTYSYLSSYESLFRKRKSSIYKGKDKFSVFGVGDYSFKPYKIVVSSLYKTINFVLLTTIEGKPVLVDDTCYQLGFDDYEQAKIIYNALNSNEIKALLSALVFKDAKRVVTKNLLMRLDLLGWCADNGLYEAYRLYGRNFPQQLSLF